MMEIVPDIPRFYTALAEWSACLVYILVMKQRFTGIKRWGIAGAALVIQSAVLIVTKSSSTGPQSDLLWILWMLVAVGLMYAFIMISCDVSYIDAGYASAKAFVLAEFIASLGWQLYCYRWLSTPIAVELQFAFLAGIYVVICWIIWRLERKHFPDSGRLGLGYRELISVAIIVIAVFSISNLSFVTAHTPFSGRYGGDIMTIRTMVDLGGLAILYAHYVQWCELHVRRELEAMQNVLVNQYQQYQMSRESVDIINRKYHDLKHQIQALRNETDEERRNKYLEELESDIKTYEAQNKTGNQVLDVLLTSKSVQCAKKGITLTCVADGTLLDFVYTMDLCSIFGNALDNAIECAERIKDSEKRLIHLRVAAQKGFVLIQVENYMEDTLEFKENLPVTRKKNKDYHGYGLKSMRYVAQKYNGTMTVGEDNHWFELKMLLPIPEEKQGEKI